MSSPAIALVIAILYAIEIAAYLLGYYNGKRAAARIVQKYLGEHEEVGP